MYFRGREWFDLVLAVLSCAFILQRRSYRREIPLEDIRDVERGSVRGVTVECTLLTIHLEDKAIHIVPARIVPEEVMEAIASGGSLPGHHLDRREGAGPSA